MTEVQHLRLSIEEKRKRWQELHGMIRAAEQEVHKRISVYRKEIDEISNDISCTTKQLDDLGDTTELETKLYCIRQYRIRSLPAGYKSKEVSLKFRCEASEGIDGWREYYFHTKDYTTESVVNETAVTLNMALGDFCRTDEFDMLIKNAFVFTPYPGQLFYTDSYGFVTGTIILYFHYKIEPRD